MLILRLLSMSSAKGRDRGVSDKRQHRSTTNRTSGHLPVSARVVYYEWRAGISGLS